jgi:hypothetical protein
MLVKLHGIVEISVDKDLECVIAITIELAFPDEAQL